VHVSVKRVEAQLVVNVTRETSYVSLTKLFAVVAVNVVQSWFRRIEKLAPVTGPLVPLEELLVVTLVTVLIVVSSMRHIPLVDGSAEAIRVQLLARANPCPLTVVCVEDERTHPYPFDGNLRRMTVLP
jgi:hypothetical protein